MIECSSTKCTQLLDESSLFHYGFRVLDLRCWIDVATFFSVLCGILCAARCFFLTGVFATAVC